jgi:hypothetical protein
VFACGGGLGKSSSSSSLV